VLVSTALLLALAGGVGSPAAAGSTDIVERLEAVPGLTVVEEQPTAAPFRFFVLSFTQPVDHKNPRAGAFQQRLTLLSRGVDRPTVLATSGYRVPTFAYREEPTQLVDGNQVTVEQRFFEPSRPDPADWSKLTIWQAATDHHRIVAALKPILAKSWLSTGGSKGGMASVYHRRFYPDDVTGTIAYSAPQDTVNNDDSAYDEFFATVGTPECRTALDAVQVEMLKRRTRLVARFQTWAADNGYTFTTVGSADRAFEFLVNGTTWAFWQYYGINSCGGVPAPAASDDALLKLPNLAGLQHYPGQDRAESYLPASLVPTFEPQAMADIDRWVKTSGSRLLFVNGQNDPWSAEPFLLGPGSRDSLSFAVARGTHNSTISRLAPTEKTAATNAVLRWAGLNTPSSTGAAVHIPALDDYNPLTDRHLNR